MHPEIEHITRVLEHVNGRVDRLKLSTKQHKLGASRLKYAKGDYEPIALAVWEAGQTHGSGVPNHFKNYFDDPSVKRAFDVLNYVGGLDRKLLMRTRKDPAGYGPRDGSI